MRREGMKSFLSLVVTICLIFGIVLSYGSRPSYAAVDDVDEYGHKSTIPDSFNEAKAAGINPYGKGAVNFSPVTELGIFQSDGNTVAVLDSGNRDKYMVKEWKVNGESVGNNLSKTLTIDSLLEATNVTVAFEKYVGFDIPEEELSSSDPSSTDTCEVKDVKRVPDDTSPEEEVRRDGNLTFTMKPEEGKMFDTLFVYGVDCLKAESGQRITVEVSGEEALETDSPSAKPMDDDVVRAGITSDVTVTKNKEDSYTISIENVQQDFNPEFTLKDKPMDVKGAKISVAGGESFVYNGKAQVPKQINVVVDGKTLTSEDYEVICKNNVNAGTATITVDGKNRYTGTATGSFVIQKRKLTIVADNLQKLYGDADPILTYNVQGLLNEDKVDVRLTRQPGENPGQYEILAEASEKENYQISCQKGTFTIVDYKNPALKNALNKTFNISWSSGHLKVKFGKLFIADGYDVFAEQCTKEFAKKPTASLASTKNSVTIKTISGRKLNQRKCYKVVVKAYRLAGGKKEYVATSEDLHMSLAFDQFFLGVQRIVQSI